jgi:hypothetical protein
LEPVDARFVTLGKLGTPTLIQVVAGFAGAHGAAIAAHEHRFGFLGHSLVGLIAGALSGYFLQILAMTAVYGGGYAMPLSKAEAIVIQALTGAVAGGIAMLLIGFVLDG